MAELLPLKISLVKPNRKGRLCCTDDSPCEECTYNCPRPIIHNWGCGCSTDKTKEILNNDV